MMASTTFITRHLVWMYFALTFAISWGGFVLVVGLGGFPGTGSQFDALLPLVASAMLAGPAVASILLIVLLSGTAGLRELLSRLLRWRVGARWYVAALLPAPVLAAAVLFALSMTSPIFTAESKAAILLAGITAGLKQRLGDISLQWTKKAVTPEHKAFLRSLKAEIRFEAEGKRFRLVHGSPRRMNEYLFEDRPLSSF
jgi:hypothetical protein